MRQNEETLMSSLEDRIKADLKAAMLGKKKDEVSALRMIQADVRNRAIDKKDDLTDEDVMNVITKALKQRKDSIASFREGGREEAAAKEEAEAVVLKRYLPEEMSEDSVRELVNGVIEESGAESMSDIGKVMGPVMQKVKGRADGSFVKQLVEEALKGGE